MPSIQDIAGINYDPWGTPESGTVPTFDFTGELQDATTIDITWSTLRMALQP